MPKVELKHEQEGKSRNEKEVHGAAIDLMDDFVVAHKRSSRQNNKRIIPVENVLQVIVADDQPVNQITIGDKTVMRYGELNPDS